MKHLIHISILGTLVMIFAVTHVDAQGLIIPSGSYIVAGNGNIVLRSNWLNNGSFTAGSSTVMFAGSTQSISGTTHTVYNNLSIAPGSTTTIDSPGQSLQSILLCNGTLNANGNLSLLSTTSQTALIDGTGTGDVTGNVTMQRHLDTTYGYKIISSPFVAATISQLSANINLTDTFPEFYKYAESVTHTGWVTDTTVTDTLVPLSGYGGNFGNSFSSATFSLHGVVNNGAMSSTIYNHNNTYTLGFNLLGNPYPSPVDWDASGGWTRTNIDNAIYYYNTSDTNRYYGTFSSYVAGVSSDGRANNMIPAMQGFFVHVSSGSYPVTGSLAVNNNARVNNLSPLYHKASALQQPLLRLSAALEGKGRPDPVVIYFNDDASRNFNSKLDAVKMINTDAQSTNLYAISDDLAHMSIYALPLKGDSQSVVPLTLSVNEGGMVAFDGSDIEYIPSGMQIFLTDVKAGVSQDLQAEPQYRVRLNAGNFENRFFLSFRPQNVLPALLSGEVFNAYSSPGVLNIDLFLLSGGKGEVVVTTLSGQKILSQKISGFGLHEIPAPWTAGVYIVSFVSDGHINSKKIFIGNK